MTCSLHDVCPSLEQACRARPTCPPQTEVCSRKCSGARRGLLTAEPSQWPLVCSAFLLKQAQIQAAVAPTPTARHDRCWEVCIWPGSLACAAGSRDCRCLMNQERLSLRCSDPHPPPLLSRVCFLRTVLMVLSPENMK